MRLLLLVVLIALSPLLVMGQARTAERIVNVPFSQLDTGNPPDGSVRYVINGLQGSAPCTSGGTGALALKVAGQWQCPKLTPGAGTGDVLGPAASTANELPLFSGTSGKSLGRSNALSGIVLLSTGVVSTLNSSGTGDVARVVGPNITGLSASTAFSSGTIPPARIITGTIVNARCLRTSNTGTIEVAASDCGTGGGGAPGGVSGNLTYNESGAFGGLSNTSYDQASGRLTFSQKANGNDTLNLQRITDSGPAGSLIRARNAANSADLFRLGVDGVLSITNTIASSNITAPATPAAGTTILWTDSTNKNLKAQDDAGNVSGTVRPIACSGTDKISAISAAGVPTCSADQGGSGTGVITLNALNTSDQSFATVDDTNIDLDISSSVSTHTLTITWVGALSKARQEPNTAYVNQGNTWTTGIQSFAAATALVVPTAAGIAPTVSGSVAYDTTSNTLEAGVSGTNRTVSFTTGAQTFSDKTLDNSTTANLRDSLFTLQDNADSTKTLNFELSGITSGQNRVITVPNANSVTVQPTTATANQFVTHVDSSGVVQKAQPAFSNLSGSMGVTQGGTGLTSTVQGDMFYADATNSIARLPKSTTATHALLNTGASNNPQWGQVPLTTGVTGVLPPANWSVLTTKGDLLVHNGTTSVRQAVSTDGFALVADSTQTSGLRWASISASAGGSTTQLQRNNVGLLGGISGATSDGTTVTFAPAALIVGGQSATPTAVTGAFYQDTDDTKLYWAKDGSTWGEVFVSGLSTVNLASTNVSGVLPLANGGSNQSSWTASRCVQVNSTGTALESAAAACGSGGGGSPGGSDTQVQFNDGGVFGGDTGLVYDKTTNTLTVEVLATSGTGAGAIELEEGTPPTVAADRLTFSAPADVVASGLLYILPADTPINGEQLTANISGTTITLSWDAAGTGGSGDALSVNGSAVTDANFINTTASGTVPSITWALNTGTTPDEVSIATVGAASATEAGVVTTGAQTFAGQKTLTTPIFATYLQSAEVTAPANPAADTLRIYVKDDGGTTKLCSIDSTGTESCGLGGGGGGSGTINAGATNTIPKYIGSTTVDDSSLSDNGTMLIYSGSGGFSLTATGGGYIQFNEGTGTALVANTVQHGASPDTPAGGAAYLWGSTPAATGVLRVTNSSGSMTVTQDAGVSHLAGSTSLDLASVLSDETGTGPAVFGTTPTITFANTGLTVRDTNASHLLTIAPGSDLTANRTLTITTGDAARTLDLSGGNVTLAGAFTTSGANALTLTTTSATNVTLPTTGTLATTGDLSQFGATTSAQLRGVLSDESGTGAAIFAGGNVGAGTATTAAADDSSTLIATTAYVQGELTAYASDTATFTNKTYDTEATGNSFSSAHKVFLPAAGCQGTTAGSFWDLPPANPAVAACVTGTNTTKGVLDFADTAGGFKAHSTLTLPGDFTGTIDARLYWTTTATSGNVKWTLATVCTATDATETDDPAFNTPSTVTTAAPGVANRVQTSVITSVIITGCAANELLHLVAGRDGNDAADTIAATARLVGMELTIRRAQ